ncbi:hypothetical protein GCM10010245_43840 [Streptomyces spectabilis]|nr:hypothetical protein GCM10010245_43840 [Streptomyces spectabilis]
MPVRAVPERPSPVTYVMMSLCTAVPAALFGLLYFIYRELFVTGGCGSRYAGVGCSIGQASQVVLAIFLFPASMLCVLFLEGIVFRPYRKGHEAYRVIVPLLVGSGAVELFVAETPLWGALTTALAGLLLLAFSRPVGVRGMLWSISRERCEALDVDADAGRFSLGQNLLLLLANAAGMAMGLLAAYRLISALS